MLRILAGLEAPDAGTVSREPPALRVADFEQALADLGCSGGEAARRELEAIATAGADVLLLDEPTNNLDFDGQNFSGNSSSSTPEASSPSRTTENSSSG